jgi:uncharacterized membrane protein
VNLEVKAEIRETGNLYIEKWSNLEAHRPGWFWTLKCNLLFYHFLDTGNCYIIRFDRLQKFDFFNYPEREQRKHAQSHATYGYLVPVADLKAAGVITQTLSLPEGVHELLPRKELTPVNTLC